MNAKDRQDALHGRAAPQRISPITSDNEKTRTILDLLFVVAVAIWGFGIVVLFAF